PVRRAVRTDPPDLGEVEVDHEQVLLELWRSGHEFTRGAVHAATTVEDQIVLSTDLSDMNQRRGGVGSPDRQATMPPSTQAGEEGDGAGGEENLGTTARLLQVTTRGIVDVGSARDT